MLHSPSTASDDRSLILILATAGFASTFAGRIADPLVQVIATDLSASVETIALLASAFALPYALIQPVLGPIGDSLGKARVMRWCLALLTLALIASAFATATWALFSVRVLSGIAAGGVIPLALATIGDRVGFADRQVALSRFLVSVILGQMAGSSLSGLLAEIAGWRGVFLIASLTAVAAFSAMLARASSMRDVPKPFSIDVALSRYASLLRDPRARALFSLVFVEALAIFGVFPFVAPLLAESGTGGPAEAGLALAGFAVGGLVYSALVGWMVRRLGLSRMLVGGGLVAGLALSAVGAAHQWWVFAAAFVVLGLGFYMLHNSFQTQVTELSAEARGSAVALHAFSFFCGQALGPVLVQAGLNGAGQMTTFALCGALTVALGAVAAWLMARTARPDHLAR
jgi:predicted MFS family arabinose efflux permease